MLKEVLIHSNKESMSNKITFILTQLTKRLKEDNIRNDKKGTWKNTSFRKTPTKENEHHIQL